MTAGVTSAGAFCPPDALRLVKEEDVAAAAGTAFGPGGTWLWRLSYVAGADKVTEGMTRIAHFSRSGAHPERDSSRVGLVVRLRDFGCRASRNRAQDSKSFSCIS